MLAAILTLCGIMTLTSCSSYDNPATNPHREAVGTWYVEYEATGTVYDDNDSEDKTSIAYDGVVEVYQFNEDGTGYWARYFFDSEQDNKPIADWGGYFNGAFHYTEATDGTVSIDLDYEWDSDYAKAWTVNYGGSVIAAKGIDGQTYQFLRADDVLKERFMEWNGLLHGGSGGFGPQAVFCRDNATLYFLLGDELNRGETWDEQTITSVYFGDQVSNSPTNENPQWNPDYSSFLHQVKRVVFDRSFAYVRPKSLYGWFYGLNQLTTVEGIEHLNTSEVTAMDLMFYACNSLTELDLTNFDVSNVKSATNMFRYCNNLQTIVCPQAWNIENSQFMFDGCNRLEGAVKYDSRYIDGSMANPENGYFSLISPVTIADEAAAWMDADVQKCKKGLTVTLRPIKPCVLNSVTVKGTNSGTEIATTAVGDGTFSFTMPGEPVVASLSIVPQCLYSFDDETIYYQKGPYTGDDDGAEFTFDNKSYRVLINGSEVFSDDSQIASLNLRILWYRLQDILLKKAVFDKSFADVKPVTHLSFSGQKNLTTIEGIEYYNTSECSNLSLMFLDCVSLTTLDLSSWDASKFSDISDMFNGCTSLTTIYCNKTWKPSGDSSNMFKGCTSLVGAVAFDPAKTDASMANPDTGYFTRK